MLIESINRQHTHRSDSDYFCLECCTWTWWGWRWMQIHVETSAFMGTVSSASRRGSDSLITFHCWSDRLFAGMIWESQWATDEAVNKLRSKPCPESCTLCLKRCRRCPDYLIPRTPLIDVLDGNCLEQVSVTWWFPMCCLGFCAKHMFCVALPEHWPNFTLALKKIPVNVQFNFQISPNWNTNLLNLQESCIIEVLYVRIILVY